MRLPDLLIPNNFRKCCWKTGPAMPVLAECACFGPPEGSHQVRTDGTKKFHLSLLGDLSPAAENDLGSSPPQDTSNSCPFYKTISPGSPDIKGRHQQCLFGYPGHGIQPWGEKSILRGKSQIPKVTPSALLGIYKSASPRTQHQVPSCALHKS